MRKTVEKKKRLARIRRKQKQDRKEKLKFISVFKIKIPSQNCDDMKYRERCQQTLQPTGLRGGV